MAKKEGLTVAVTGAAGYIGSRVIAALQGDESVGRILGFDLFRPEGTLPSKLIFDTVDVRDPALESRFAGVDVLVHLAFIMDPIKDEAEMRDVNVNGSQNVFRCAGKAGVRKIVYTSSATAYGAHPDNDVPLTEESPLRANLDFNYPAHKLEVEYVTREIREEFPDMIVTVLRPAVVFGKHVDNAWSHVLELPAAPSVQGHRPPMQFVHEDDVARAVAFAVSNDLDGAYNLAPRDHLEWDQMMEILGKRTMGLPEPVAFALQERLWALGLAEAPAGFLHYVMHPWVVSSEKLQAAGFHFEHSSYDAFMETVARTSKVVRLGRTRVERSDLRRGALAGAGVMAGLLTWRGLRRRSA
jgi:UDP-glucose 4-epimerase